MFLLRWEHLSRKHSSVAGPLLPTRKIFAILIKIIFASSLTRPNNLMSVVSQVAWIKSDTKAILAIHDHVITNNARLDITHNDKVESFMVIQNLRTILLQDTWTLTLRDVQTKDRGPYMCQVNSTPVKSQVGPSFLCHPLYPLEGCPPRGCYSSKNCWRPVELRCGGAWGRIRKTSLQSRGIPDVSWYKSLLFGKLICVHNGFPEKVIKCLVKNF